MIEVFLCRFFWIEIFPTLFWGLVVSGTIIGSLCIICPLIKYHINSRTTILDKQHQFEEKMKADAFDREKEWADLLELKASTDDALKEKMDDLNKEKKKLEAELEMEKYNRGLLEKQLKQYSDIFADLKVEIKPKEDNK